MTTFQRCRKVVKGSLSSKKAEQLVHHYANERHHLPLIQRVDCAIGAGVEGRHE